MLSFSRPRWSARSRSPWPIWGASRTMPGPMPRPAPRRSSWRPASGPKRWSRPLPRCSRRRRSAAVRPAKSPASCRRAWRIGRPLENVAALLAIRVPAPLLTSADLARRSSPAWPSAPPDEFQATVVRWLAAYFIGFYALLVLWHAAGLPGDRVLLAGGARPDRPRVRPAAQPRRSAARHRPDRPLHAGRAGWPGARGHGVVGHGGGAVVHPLRLPAARRGDRPLGPVTPAGRRARHERREGEPRPGAAD